MIIRFIELTPKFNRIERNQFIEETYQEFGVPGLSSELWTETFTNTPFDVPSDPPRIIAIPIPAGPIITPGGFNPPPIDPGETGAPIGWPAPPGTWDVWFSDISSAANQDPNFGSEPPGSIENNWGDNQNFF